MRARVAGRAQRSETTREPAARADRARRTWDERRQNAQHRRAAASPHCAQRTALHCNGGDGARWCASTPTATWGRGRGRALVRVRVRARARVRVKVRARVRVAHGRLGLERVLQAGHYLARVRGRADPKPKPKANPKSNPNPDPNPSTDPNPKPCPQHYLYPYPYPRASPPCAHRRPAARRPYPKRRG